MYINTKRRRGGLVEYLLHGKKDGEKHTRQDKDLVVPLFGNLNIFDKTIKYLEKEKKYKDNYNHTVVSFTDDDWEKLTKDKSDEEIKDVLNNIVKDIIAHHTSGYEEEEVVAYAEAHLPKHQKNKKGMQRFRHLHIAIARYSVLDDTQMQLAYYNNAFLDETLRNHLCKKYGGLDIPRDSKKKNSKKQEFINKNIELEEKAKSSNMKLRREEWIELTKDIKNSDELVNYLVNNLGMEDGVNFKIGGSKNYRYIKILKAQIRNGKFEDLNLRGGELDRFLIINNKEKNKNENKTEEEILESYYKTRSEKIDKRRSKEALLAVEKLRKEKKINNSDSGNEDKFKFNSFQNKIFNDYYNIKSEFDFKKYYLSRNEDNEIKFDNKSKRFEIIDKGDEIVATTIPNAKVNTTIERVELMFEIALAKGWELHEIDADGSESFKKEFRKQLNAKLKAQNKTKVVNNIVVDEINTRSFIKDIQKDIQNKNFIAEENKKKHLSEIKSTLKAQVILDFAVDNYNLNSTTYIVTDENKIKNLASKQQPKNLIDFLHTEIHLEIKDAIRVCEDKYKDKNNHIIVAEENNLLQEQEEALADNKTSPITQTNVKNIAVETQKIQKTEKNTIKMEQSESLEVPKTTKTTKEKGKTKK